MTAVPAERILPGEDGWERHRARYLRAAARVAPGARVLDAGCGIGYGSALLAEAGAEVTGVDASGEAIERARAEYGADRFAVADVRDLPFADAAFDAVVCFEVIEHVHDPGRLVGELARTLRPGGTLFLSTPNARMERAHLHSVGYAPNPYHVSLLGRRALEALLRRAGLRPVLFGLTRDRGRLHAGLQALDPLGLRLRVAPARRDSIERLVAPGAVGAATPRFRFSRALAYSAPTLFVEAAKP